MDRWNIKTLVDVTPTGARRGEDDTKVSQQANYMTVYQVIGLRSNPTDIVVTEETGTVKGFGSSYKDIKKYWSIDFTIEAEGSITEDMLVNDFELVPFIDGLTESVKFKEPVFYTQKTKTNILFFKNETK